MIGKSVGRYHILEQIGQGGMATVYKAYDTRLEREVAIKFIRASTLTESLETEMLARFRREAQALSKVSHPNILPVYDYGEHEGELYLVTAFMPGGTLQKRLGRPMPWAEAARLLAPIARALAYAHSLNIVHRDIKPGNILLSASGLPVLSDFGIAKILEIEDVTNVTRTGVGIGTPAYMAPEQALGQGIDHRADIYALGIVFYELVTGRLPFVADTPLAVLVKHASEPLPRPKSLIPNLPDEVERVLIKALAKRPEHRYASMDEFAASLDGIAQEPRTPARAPSARRAVLAATAAVGLIGLLACGAVTIYGLAAFFWPEPVPSATAAPTQAPTTSVPSSTPTARPSPTVTPHPSPSPPPTATVSPVDALTGRIVFTCSAGGVSQICLIRPDGSGRVQLTEGELNLAHPALAPDGETIIYDCQTAGLVFEICARGTEGSAVTRLTQHGVESLMPAFSPDGAQIVYASNAGASERFPFHLWVMERNGANAHPITFEASNADPTWSPDGQFISFASTRVGGLQLWVAHADGTTARQITNDLAVQQRHTWSSDTRRLAIAIGLDGNRNIYTVSTDGSDLRQLTFGGTEERPAFSPDGQWIVFASRRDGHSQLYLMRADGSDVTRLTHDPVSEDSQPHWGP